MIKLLSEIQNEVNAINISLLRTPAGPAETKFEIYVNLSESNAISPPRPF